MSAEPLLRSAQPNFAYELVQQQDHANVPVSFEAQGGRGDRVELRGFGAFSVKNRPARTGRNPRTGAHVSVAQKSVPFFKTGKEMRERLNKAAAAAAAAQSAATPAT